MGNVKSQWIFQGLPWLLNLGLLLVLAWRPLLHLSSVPLLLLWAALSFAIYHYLAHWMLLRRRAWLGYVTQSQSSLRVCFWHSVWLRLLSLCGALLMALGALIATANLGWTK